MTDQNQLTTTTADQLSILEQQITDLGRQLAPPRDDQIASRLMLLTRSGMPWPKGIDLDHVIEIYTFALRGIPYIGIKIAVDKLISGGYENQRDFIPIPPALATLARREASVLTSDRARLRERAESLSAGFPVSNSEDRQKSILRVREMVKNVKRANEEFKGTAAGPPVTRTMTKEEAEYWAKIDALKDSPTLTQEQIDFRDRVHAAIDKAE